MVHYNPDTIVYGNMATEKKEGETQRKRWEGGRFEVLKKYGLPLLKMWSKDKKKVCYLWMVS